MFHYGFAWSKLYLATTELASTDAPLVDRVQAAYWHLAPLNNTNVSPRTFERLKAMRAEFASRISDTDEEDGTITLIPLTASKAATVALEIVSMFDEIAKRAGATPDISDSSHESCN